MEKEWGEYYFFGSKSINSEEVGILLNPDLSCEILYHIELVSWMVAGTKNKDTRKVIYNSQNIWSQ